MPEFRLRADLTIKADTKEPDGSKWRCEKKCAKCPFHSGGPGLALREGLGRGRWKSITDDLRRGNHFFCHETTVETGDGTKLVCAGSIEWQDERGISSQYVRICERISAIAER